LPDTHQGTAVGNHGILQNQLAQVCRQIHSLEMSENQRLARELQSIELNIQETERQLLMVSQ
jgi:hypothetical protein